MSEQPQEYWKQQDRDYSPTVVVNERNAYIGTANNETSAKLFIAAHNAAVSEEREKYNRLLELFKQLGQQTLGHD